MDIATLFLGFPIVCQMFSLIIRLVIISMQYYFGWTFWILFLLAKIYHFAADIIFCVLLILLSSGFGTLWEKQVPHVNTFGAVAVIMVIRYVWTVISWIFIKSDHSYHDYEGTLGKFEIISSLGLGGWFLWSWFYSGLVKEKKFESYMKTIIFCGLTYFL